MSIKSTDGTTAYCGSPMFNRIFLFQRPDKANEGEVQKNIIFLTNGLEDGLLNLYFNSHEFIMFCC